MAIGKVLVRTVIMTLIGASILALYQINNGLFDALRYSGSVIVLALTGFVMNMIEHYWKSRRATQKG
ncbi:membrane-bound proton-translocating pyrophosphatase [Asticcacaulis excentricus CB 48]|uniref:Membrane-bound proton-translocating pyrophosphatase n=2 Tax=Asticcacaulis excentricus TaxID=78587 RepID=E8RQJ7_ASTEC|nr:membrane-bound proton-translocating pyrophosphatase [Asticcacaulis excentricus CB 48]